MKTLIQTFGNSLKFQTAGKSFKKKIYLGLLFSLVSTANFAQNFVEVTGTPFEGDNWNEVSFVDIDNDNDPDVLIGEKLYSNNGSGSFELTMDFDPADSLDGMFSAFADFNNDNDQDLFISYIVNGSPDPDFLSSSLCTNNGSGTFQVNPSDQTLGQGSVAFADVDSDGDQDMIISGYGGIISNYGDPPIGLATRLCLNDGSGNFTEVTGTPFVGVGLGSIAITDIDNDNDPDILITGYDDEWHATANLYSNDGSGNFTQITGTPFYGTVSGDPGQPSSYGTIAFADIDNDNDEDVLIIGDMNYGPVSAILYTNDGSGNFTQVIGTSIFGVKGGSVAFADIDNDNDQDVLVTGKNLEGIPTAIVYTNDGSGNFTEVSDTTFEGVYGSSVGFADIDSDGDQDVLITGQNADGQNIAKLYENLLITTSVPEENTAFGSVSIYPNPSQGQITVDLQELSNVSIDVYSLNGSRVYHRENINGPQYQFEFNADAGIYILEVSTQKETQRYKLVKE